MPRFQPGQSGNPNGRPKGSRNQASLALDQFAEERAQEVLQASIGAALQGDQAAAKLVLDRVWPVKRGRPVHLALPVVKTAADVAEAMTEVFASMSTGQITPEEAQAVASVLELKRKTIETAELEARVAALEGERQ